MNIKQYKVSMEIEGPTACFSIPGDAHRSYSVPPWSAAKGIFESVVFVKSAVIVPTAVEICKPIIRCSHTTNYRGPLREKYNNSFMRRSTVLLNVCYRLYGVCKKVCDNKEMTTNPEHALQAEFNRRLNHGLFRHLPFLGFSEFLATYCGPIREDTAERFVQPHNEYIPTMRYTNWNSLSFSTATNFEYRYDVNIISGRLYYDK